MIGDGECVTGSDLKLPLSEEDFGVRSFVHETRFHASVRVCFHNRSSSHVVRADTAVVRSLRAGVPTPFGPPEEATVLHHQRVFLFDAEQGLVGSGPVG